MITEEQRIERRKSLGGSDAAAAVGLSPWNTPYRLWCEKTGLGELMEDDLATNDFAHFGNVLEDVVATEFMRRTGHKVWRHKQQITHPTIPWMTANIDRRLIGRGVREGLECKTASQFAAKNWGEEGDQIPIQYFIQCMHYLAVTGWARWHVAVLIAGNDFRTFVIERDEEMIEDLIKRESEFWECVTSQTPPEPITLDDAYMRWPKDYGAPIVASPQCRRAYDRFMKLREERDAIEEKMVAEGLIIRQWMGDHTTLLDVDGVTKLATWKAQSARRIDTDKLRKEHPAIALACTKVSDSRVMRYTEKKK